MFRTAASLSERGIDFAFDGIATFHFGFPSCVKSFPGRWAKSKRGCFWGTLGTLKTLGTVGLLPLFRREKVEKCFWNKLFLSILRARNMSLVCISRNSEVGKFIVLNSLMLLICFVVWYICSLFTIFRFLFTISLFGLNIRRKGTKIILIVRFLWCKLGQPHQNSLPPFLHSSLHFPKK